MHGAAPPPVGFPGLFPILRPLPDDGRNLAQRLACAAIPVRKEPAEFVERVVRIESDQYGIAPYPRTREEPAWPSREVSTLELLEPFAPDSRDRGNLRERQTMPLPVQTKTECKERLGRFRALVGSGGERSEA